MALPLSGGPGPAAMRSRSNYRKFSAPRRSTNCTLKPLALTRGPLVYVELDPERAMRKTRHARTPCSPLPALPGAFAAQAGGRTRNYVPFYFIRDEHYTMYSERS